MFIDKKRAEKAPPTFVDDAELSCVTEEEKKSLLPTGLLAKLPIDGSLSVKRTGMGFDFVAESGEPVVYKGKIHQKKSPSSLKSMALKWELNLRMHLTALLRSAASDPIGRQTGGIPTEGCLPFCGPLR